LHTLGQREIEIGQGEKEKKCEPKEYATSGDTQRDQYEDTQQVNEELMKRCETNHQERQSDGHPGRECYK